MSTFAVPTLLSLLLLAALLLAAVISDLRERRIPNRLVVVGLCVAVLLHLGVQWAGKPTLAGSAFWSPLVGLLAGGLALMPLYLLRACGAGDVKLMAMVGAFIGAPTALRAVLFTLLAGGILSLIFMLGRGVARQALENIRFLLTDWAMRLRGGQVARLAPLANTAARLPYGVAIAAGTAFALWQRFQAPG
jgi:prepilin peptidase CpaA